MSRLRDRELHVKINEESFVNQLDLKILYTTEIKNKHIDFTGKREKKGATGTLSIYNLDFEFTEKMSVELWGGYSLNGKPSIFRIFKGDITDLSVTKEGVDTKTTIQLIDGYTLTQAEKFRAYTKDSTIKGMLTDAIDDLKKAGAEVVENILEKINEVTGGKKKKTAKAKARKKMLKGIEQILSGYEKDADPIVHNGIIDIIIDGEIGGAVIDLTPDSGLIGSINKSVKFEKGKTTKSSVNLTSLMLTDYRIGQGISAEKKLYHIAGISYNLSNYRTPFYAELEVI